MKRDIPQNYKTMSHSTMSNFRFNQNPIEKSTAPIRQNRLINMNHSESQISVQSNKSKSRSTEKYAFQYQYVNHKPQLTCLKNPFFQSETSNLHELDIPDKYHTKNHPINSGQNILLSKINDLSSKLKENQYRLSLLETNSTSNKNHFNRVMEEILSTLKSSDTAVSILNLEEKQTRLENMVSQLKINKIERKQLQNMSSLKSNAYASKIQELGKENMKMCDEIAEIKSKIIKLLPKVQFELLNINHKYESFIESNIIRSIENVNKLSQVYQEEICHFKTHQDQLSRRIQDIMGVVEFHNKRVQLIQENQPKKKKNWTHYALQNVYKKHIKIVEKIIVVNEKQNEKNMINIHGSKTKSNLSETIMNNLYEKTDIQSKFKQFQVNQQQKKQLENILEENIYYLDTDFYLLDQQNNYLLNQENLPIKLNGNHITTLKQWGLLL